MRGDNGLDRFGVKNLVIFAASFYQSVCKCIQLVRLRIGFCEDSDFTGIYLLNAKWQEGTLHPIDNYPGLIAHNEIW